MEGLGPSSEVMSSSAKSENGSSNSAVERLVFDCQTTSASVRIVLPTVPRVGRSCELFPDEFFLHLLQLCSTLPFKPHSGLRREFVNILNHSTYGR